MFDLERFIADCHAAIGAESPHRAVCEVVARAVADPSAVLTGLGEPTRAGIDGLHRSDDLVILNVVWGPHMTVIPHDHRMWAVIGLYGGQEDNAFFRRVPGGLEPSGGREVPAKEVLVLGDDAIHSVANTRRDFAVALHVYGGDFFAVDRSEWDAETYEERPRDLGRTMRLFEEANARWRAQA